MRPESLSEQAARWRMRLEAGEVDAAELQSWLAGDPRRRRAFEQMQSVWTFFDGVRDEPSMRSPREALARRTKARVRARRSVSLAAALAAASVAAAVLFAGRETHLYETPAGTRQSVRLSDGSAVLLDARSRLRVRFSRGERRLVLEKGQARFDVAHDARRPFIVRAGARQVVATGTRFDIDLAERTVTVALLQGRVRILGDDGARGSRTRAIDLRAGQQFVLAPDGGRVTRFDPGAVTAWETGHVQFDGTPLDVAVKRINRYATIPLVLKDPALSRLTLSGVFHQGDSKALAEAVTALLPVTATCLPDGRIQLAAAASAGAGADLTACRQAG
jgi:transmembrane sensor